jgi:hypothetical protein
MVLHNAFGNKIHPSQVGGPFGAMPQASVFGRRQDPDSDGDVELGAPSSAEAALGRRALASYSKRLGSGGYVARASLARTAARDDSSGSDEKDKSVATVSARQENDDPWWYKLLVPSGSWTAGYATHVDQLPDEVLDMTRNQR